MHQIVPKALAVAEPLHHVMPDAPADASHAPEALACPHTGAPCPALRALFGHLTPAGKEAKTWLQALAPCGQCRTAFECGTQRLRRLRLGQREREILMAAAAAEGPMAVTEPGMSRSLSAARRRAALSLSRAGLAAPHEDGHSQRATIVLTELGFYVMSAFGRFISSGKPVRWTRPARGAALPGRDPAELLSETLARTEGALRGTLTELKGVLLAAIGGRYQNPARLDEVTRHLERKATLLKAVLETQQTVKA